MSKWVPLIQYPRLLDECFAVLERSQIRQIAESMDLTIEEVLEIFQMAERDFEILKDSVARAWLTLEDAQRKILQGINQDEEYIRQYLGEYKKLHSIMNPFTEGLMILAKYYPAAQIGIDEDVVYYGAPYKPDSLLPEDVQRLGEIYWGKYGEYWGHLL